MAAEMDDLIEFTETCEVEFNTGAKIDVVYRPNAYTPELELKQSSMVDSATVGNMYVVLLLPVIVSWTITRKGKNIPVNEKSLQGTPTPILAAIAKAIGDAMTPGKLKDTTSIGSF